MKPNGKSRLQSIIRRRLTQVSCGLLFLPLILFTAGDWAAAQWLDPSTGKPFAPKRSGRVAKRTRPVEWSNPGSNEGMALMDAMTEGKIEPLESWMNEGLEVDGLYPWGNHLLPLLSFAMEAKSVEVVKFLLDKGADVDQVSEAKLTDYEAARKEARHAANGEENQEIYDSYSEMIEVFSPLMHAASADFPKGVALLIENGADADVVGAGGVTALMTAADSNSVESLRLLLEAGRLLDERLEDKESLERLNDGGKLLMKIGVGNASALWIAASRGHAEVVKVLLDAGADREAEGYCADAHETPAGVEFCSPARIAELKGHREIAAVLRGEGALQEGRREEAGRDIVVDPRTHEEREALEEKLSLIMKNDDLKTFKAYIDAGLDIGPQTVEGSRLLSRAVSSKAMKILKFLIDEGADVNAFNRVEKTFKIREGENRWRSEKRIVDGNSPLMTAAMNGCDECVDMLLEAEADVNGARHDGSTALMNASYMAGDSIVGKLLEAGANVDAVLEMEGKVRLPFVNGASALWISAWRGQTEVFKLLLEAGADPDIEADCREERKADKEEETCSVGRIAELRGRTEILALINQPSGGVGSVVVTKEEQTAGLLEGGLKREEFHSRLQKIAREKDVGALRTLIEEGLDVDILVDVGGLVPILSLAVVSDNTEGVRLLLREGADPDSMSLNAIGGNLGGTGFIQMIGRELRSDDIPRNFIPVYSPLMYAAFKGNLEAIGLLLESGANVNAAGVGGQTALMASAAKNKPLALNRLIKAGAHLDAQISNEEGAKNVEADGATALWFAAFTGSKGTAAILLKAGADPRIEAECRSAKVSQDERTCNARRIAELRGHTALAQIIDRLSRQQFYETRRILPDLRR